MASIRLEPGRALRPDPSATELPSTTTLPVVLEPTMSTPVR